MLRRKKKKKAVRKVGQQVILTIDDDPDFNVLLKKVLERAGFYVETTEKVETFFERLKALNPHLCILDINLDKYSGEGFKVIEAIRNKFSPSLPLIVMSRRIDQEDVNTALKLGASDYLSKPLDDTVLIAKIQQYINLDDEVVGTLPFRKIPDKFSDCDFELDLKIKRVSESGILFTGGHFLAKGTRFEVGSDLLTEITGIEGDMSFTITEATVDSETKLNDMFVEFEKENIELISKVRNWLSKNVEWEISEDEEIPDLQGKSSHQLF